MRTKFYWRNIVGITRKLSGLANFLRSKGLRDRRSGLERRKGNEGKSQASAGFAYKKNYRFPNVGGIPWKTGRRLTKDRRKKKD